MSIGIRTAIGIAASVILALTLIFRRWNVAGDLETGAKVPAGEWRYGIDISHHNTDGIVWDSLYVLTDKRGRTIRDHHLARDIRPVSFVFIKATEGMSMVDKDFKRNWRDAGMSGLRRGAYHFFRSSKDGEAQARLFIKTVGDLRFKDLPPVLDIETIHRGGSRKRLNEEALKWLKVIESHYGRRPIVYTGSSFATDYLSKDITDNYPIWVAHYEKDKPFRGLDFVAVHRQGCSQRRSRACGPERHEKAAVKPIIFQTVSRNLLSSGKGGFWNTGFLSKGSSPARRNRTGRCLPGIFL